MMENEDMLREIINAKKNAEKKAGMVKSSDIGYVDMKDKKPTSIHKYQNLEKCECNCHPEKLDCMDCYDHPIHLNNAKKQ